MACFAKHDCWSSLLANINTAGGKFICFTKKSLLEDEEILLIRVTDGVDIWQLEISEEDVKNYSKQAGPIDEEEYLNKMKEAFQKSEIQASVVPQRLILTLGSRSAGFTFDLFEVTAQQKKDELQHILFRLVDNVKELEGKLRDANEKLKRAEESTKMESPNKSPFKDPEAKKSKVVQRQRQVKGHSVINPGSKRKQAAKGVVFE